MNQGQQVAQTILNQLGGQGRLRIMTGAKNFAAYSPASESPHGKGCGGVSFRFPKPKHAGSPNHCKIILNSMDTYDVEFGAVRGTSYKVTKELSGVYADQLVEIFESATGLYLTF